MLAGRETHGPWLRLGLAEEFRTALAEMRAAEAAFAGARARKAEAGRRALAADVALTGWLAKARLVLMLALGSEWSERWVAAGFTHCGTNVPKRLGARLELARCVVAFLAKYPGFAVAFAGVTAEAGRAVYEEIAAAGGEWREAASAAGKLKRVRDAAEKTLRWRMRGTVLMLSAALDKGDPRWLAFGLNRPQPDAPAPLRPPAGTVAPLVRLTPEPT